MQFRHVIAQASHRITRRYPFLRYLSLTSLLVSAYWFYTIYDGERDTYKSHIEACQWDKWEQWPQNVEPHHLVFVADPQLVDPHTYPGRPWPLSSLTETYTDLYMARNFRLINEKLDPDSIVFLGDLFDGGREWAPSRARDLRANQKHRLVDLGVLKEEEGAGQTEKPNAFVPGEDGRWKKWDSKQWNKELERFGRIFSAPDQLYPDSERELLPAFTTTTDSISIENGANETLWQEYGVAGRKYRRVMTSLPGNHDVGFGAGVQLPIRDRFESHFGKGNNVYVLGNHTFVSLDAPSLSAFDEYVPSGEVTVARQNQYRDVWNPTSEYLDGLPPRAARVVAATLNEFFPGAHPAQNHVHDVLDLKDGSISSNSVTPEKVPQLPVILLSHVPLYRNPDTDCGRLREKGKAISISRGYQYQNVLTPTLSGTLAKKVSAVGDIELVFSGDDHDYCDVTHRFNVGRWDEDEKRDKVVLRSIREITVKSFSWAMGVRRPGFLLASLWNPVDKMGQAVGTPLPTIQTHLCLLPDQLSIFISYGSLLGWTLLILLLRAIVIGIRNRPVEDESDSEDEQSQHLYLPRYKPRIDLANGKANGYGGPDRSKSTSPYGRQRASSTSTSTANGNNNNNNLSVQRHYNARTRSVSPAAYAVVPELKGNSGLLVEKAGYYPAMRWQDPDESDEESHIGEDLLDSQAKSKKRKRPRTRVRRALDEFLISVALVAVPSGLFYGFLIEHG